MDLISILKSLFIYKISIKTKEEENNNCNNNNNKRKREKKEENDKEIKDRNCGPEM